MIPLHNLYGFALLPGHLIFFLVLTGGE